MSLPIHITGMENVKGQQAINAILDSINNEIDNHKYNIRCVGFHTERKTEP